MKKGERERKIRVRRGRWMEEGRTKNRSAIKRVRMRKWKEERMETKRKK